jgi:ligand-binding sensor domain-containing protein/two-component sensor histidine kinase
VAYRLLALLALALSALAPTARALDPRLSLTQYTHRIWLPQQGFTEGSVQRIWQGPEGYIWLGTQRGLVRFDGVRFTPAESIFPGLPSNLSITRNSGVNDAENGMWIGTTDSGVYLLRDHGVTHYSAKNGLPSDGIACVVPSHDGSLWVCTTNGLARIRNGQVEAFNKAPSAPGNVFSACEDDKGVLWLGGANPNFSTYSNGVFTPFHLKSIPADWGVISLQCSDGVVWAGTSKGLLRIQDGKERQFTTADGLADDIVYSLGTGSDHTLWVGTKGGFSRLHNDEFSSFGTGDGLSQSTAYSVFEDREGSLWVGTKFGLNQFVDSRATPYTRDEGLPSNNVGPVIEDSKGAVWVGTLDAGLAHMEAKRFVSITTRQGLSSDHVHALADDFMGDLWVGTDAGVDLVRNSRVTGHFSTANGLPSNTITALYHTIKGAMWVGTTFGPALYSGGHFVVPANAPQEQVHAIGEDAQGRVLFATERSVYMVSGGKAASFTPSGVTFRSVNVIYLDPDGLVWLGTDTFGLGLVDGEEVTRYTTREGLFDNTIYGIVRDDADRMWMSCSKGVYFVPRIELRKLAIGDLRRVTSTPYIPTDGQRVIEGRAGVGPGAWTMGDGHLWFSTIRGLIVIDASHKQDYPAPQVSIEDPIVNGEIMSPQSLASLPPAQRNIEFRYTGLSFLAPSGITFRYKLDGYDKDWIDAGDRRDAIYTNLPPGKFSFHVTACSQDGHCNQEGSAVQFTLASYYYQRIWFYPLLALIIGGVIWLVHKFRIRQVQQKYDVIVNERSRIARELHDTLIQGFSGITMALQAFSSRLHAPKDQEALEDIIQDAAACLTETRRSVAGLRSGGEEDGRGRDAGLAGSIADAARQITETKDIDLKLKIEEVSQRLPADVEYNLLRIAAEALANAVKHSGANTIEVALSGSESALHLEVKDNGSGFIRKENGYTNEGHYGLVGMKERAATIGAELEISSVPGRGTTVSVVLPKAVEALR